jgi:hypothetical protein
LVKGGDSDESLFVSRGWHSPPAGGWGSNRDPLPGAMRPTARRRPRSKTRDSRLRYVEWSREGSMMRVRLSAQDSRTQHVGPFVCVGYMPRQALARVTGGTNLARANGAANVGAAHRAATPNAMGLPPDWYACPPHQSFTTGPVMRSFRCKKTEPFGYRFGPLSDQHRHHHHHHHHRPRSL